jgi:hypothetical protein
MNSIMRMNLARKLNSKTAKSRSNSGFTLMDLMVGATMTTAVIAAAGYGVASMISTSTASTSRSERRVELSRSNDFIATEIREGNGIVKDVSVSTELPTASATAFAASYAGKVDTTSVKKVLMVKTTETTPIVYFVAKPTSGSARGPRAIYRWGPAFDSTTGNYSNVSTPSSWVSEVLVDQIQNASGTTPTCSSGTVNGDSGFYACVDSSGKSAQIFQNGKISKVLGASENHEVSMNAGSRKTTVTVASASFATGATAVAPFTIVDGGVVIPKTSTITVKNIASEYYRPTSGTISLTGGTIDSAALPSVGNTKTFTGLAANTTLAIEGCSKASSTTYYTSSNNSTNVKFCPKSTNTTHQGKTVFTLKNGDTIPTVSPALNQVGIKDILKPYADSTGKKIKLDANQVIYLWELYSTATSGSDAQYYDIQDIVVLATIN